MRTRSKVKRLMVSMDSDFYEVLVKAAKHYGISLAGLIRLSVLEKLRRDGVIK